MGNWHRNVTTSLEETAARDTFLETIESMLELKLKRTEFGERVVFKRLACPPVWVVAILGGCILNLKLPIAKAQTSPSITTSSIQLPTSTDPLAAALTPKPVIPGSAAPVPKIGAQFPAQNGKFQEFMPTSDAIRMFESRISANPLDHYSMVIAAQLYLREGREKSQHRSFEQAEILLRRAIDVAPDNINANTWLVSALVSQHKFQSAVDQSDAALKLSPENQLLLSARGDALLEMGRIDEAEKIFSEIGKSINTPGVLARQARVLELRGHLDQAIELINKALQESIEFDERPQTTAWYDYRLAELHLGQGRLPEAEKHALNGLTRNPGDPKLTKSMARVLAARGELRKSRRVYETLIQLETSPTSMAEYAELLQRMGEHQLAAKWLENADRLMVRELATTGTAHFRDRAVFLLDNNRDPSQALELAQQDLNSRQDIFAHDTLAWAQLKSGQPQQALESIQTAIRLGTRDAKLYYHAAEIARVCELPEQATTWLALAKEINPHASFLQ